MIFEVSRAVGCIALAVGLASCGDLADQHSEPPVLMTFQGSLTVAADSAAPTGTIRVALLWHIPHDGSHDESVQCFSSSGDGYDPFEFGRRPSLLLDSIQQAVDITPQFPSAFQLDVRQPPPQKAMYEYEPSVSTDQVDNRKTMNAQASFVVYLDGNDNGRLDARTDTALSPDQVLSARSSYALLSFDPRTSALPPSYFVVYSSDDVDHLKRGYNLLSDGEHGGLLPPETEVTLELRPTPGLQSETCTNACSSVRMTEECPADPPDLAPISSDAQHGYTADVDNGADAWTWQDGPDSFVYETRECFKVSQPDPTQDYYTFISDRIEATGCEGLERSCRYDARGQPPANWPCQTFTERGLLQPQLP